MRDPESRLAYLFPGSSVFPTITIDSEPRSRLCEISWIDEETFGPKIVAVTASLYADLSKMLGRELRPGMLGEQLVITEPVSPSGLIQVGDALFEVDKCADLSSLVQSDNILDFWAYELQLIEEGLVEPGAPVVAVSQKDR